MVIRIHFGGEFSLDFTKKRGIILLFLLVFLGICFRWEIGKNIIVVFCGDECGNYC